MRWCVALALLLVACDSTSPLVVNLRTDLRSGRQFALVRTEVVDGAGTSHEGSTFLEASDDALAGVQIAELAVAHGSSTVTVTLFDFAGQPLLSRTELIDVDGPTSIVMLMTSDCIGVVCSGETSECVAGTCVSRECTAEDPSSCGSATCEADSECPDVSDCTSSMCRESFCVAVPDDGVCGDGEFCATGEGCEPVPGEDAGAPEEDAGPPDGGPSDAGPPDGGPTDGGQGSCEVPTTAVFAFTVEGPIPAGWECVSCADGDPLFGRFPRGFNVAGAEGGTEGHSHTYSATTMPSVGESRVLSGGTATAEAAPVSHLHPVLMGTTDPASNIPPFTRIRYIRPTAPTRTLPTGTVLILGEATPPPDTTALPALNGLFLIGGEAGEEGGSTEHSDVIEATLAPTMSVGLATNRDDTTCSLATQLHVHGLNAAIEQPHLPPHVEMVFAVTTAPIPVPLDARVMFAADPPAGWENVSRDGEPFFERFIRAAPTSSFASDLGAPRHAGSVVRESGPAMGNDDFFGQAGCNAVTDQPRSPSMHIHDVAIVLSEESHLPPYRDVIIARQVSCM